MDAGLWVIILVKGMPYKISFVLRRQVAVLIGMPGNSYGDVEDTCQLWLEGNDTYAAAANKLWA